MPKSASGTPKDAAAPQAASDWLFLVPKGLLDSSPALLQKSSFSYVNSIVLKGSGPPESSLGALGSVAIVSFGASLRRLRTHWGQARRRDVVPRPVQGLFRIFSVQASYENFV